MKTIVIYILTLVIIFVTLLYVTNNWLIPYANTLPTSIYKIIVEVFSASITTLAVFTCALFLLRKDKKDNRRILIRRCLLFNIIVFFFACCYKYLAIYFLSVLNNVMLAVASIMVLSIIICYILYKHKKF